jgi:hypothetical protein
VGRKQDLEALAAEALHLGGVDLEVSAFQAQELAGQRQGRTQVEVFDQRQAAGAALRGTGL